MRVLVDTSAWVDFLNGFPSPAADALAELLRSDDDVCTCGIVVAEVFQGLRREEGRETIRRSFEDLIFLEPSSIRSYLRAAELYRARSSGNKPRGNRRTSSREINASPAGRSGGARRRSS